MYNFLAIINKAILEKKKTLIIPYSTKFHSMVHIFYKQNVFINYLILTNKIRIDFNIIQNQLVLHHLKFNKKTTVGKYITHKQLKRLVFRKNKVFIMTTQIGLVFSSYALKNKRGGFILAEYIL